MASVLDARCDASKRLIFARPGVFAPIHPRTATFYYLTWQVLLRHI